MKSKKMSPKSLANLRSWKKGQSGNPNGKPKTPKDIKRLKTLSKTEFENSIQKYLFMTKDELQGALKQKSTNILEMLIASILHKAIIQGDQKRLEYMVDRVLGKIQNKVEVSTDGHGMLMQIVEHYESKKAKK